MISASQVAQSYKYSDELTVEFIQKNPKREGAATHKKYDKYKVATTIQEARGLGASTWDIRSDLEHGYVKIDGKNVTEMMGEAVRGGVGVVGVQASRDVVGAENRDCGRSSKA